ncbi:MAG: DUF5750 family protein [Methanobacteriaceae archaeon]
MFVKIDSFALDGKKGYIKYKVSDMDIKYLKFFNDNLKEETEIIDCDTSINSSNDNSNNTINTNTNNCNDNSTNIINANSNNCNDNNSNNNDTTCTNSIHNNCLIITSYFNKEYFPFQSKTAEYRLNDFIAREEIEMAAFLTEFLEEFK